VFCLAEEINITRE